MGVKLLHERTFDNPAVTFVPDVKEKVNATLSTPYLSLHDLLGKTLVLPLPLSSST